MSRSGYVDDFGDYDDDPLALARWRSAVSNAIRSKRGQAFLLELAAALDAMPDKRLTAEVWDEPVTGMPFSPRGGDVCALGVVTRARGIDTSHLDPEDDSGVEWVAKQLNIAPAMAREIVFMNDDAYHGRDMSPEKRWRLVRKWVADHIINQTT